MKLCWYFVVLVPAQSRPVTGAQASQHVVTSVATLVTQATADYSNGRGGVGVSNGKFLDKTEVSHHIYGTHPPPPPIRIYETEK